MVSRPWPRGTRKPLPSRGRARRSRSAATNTASATSEYSISPRIAGRIGYEGLEQAGRLEGGAGQDHAVGVENDRSGLSRSIDSRYRWLRVVAGFTDSHRGGQLARSRPTRRQARLHDASSLRRARSGTPVSASSGSWSLALPGGDLPQGRDRVGLPGAAASYRGGAQASMLISSADPALMPPSRGSTSRLNTSSPITGAQHLDPPKRRRSQRVGVASQPAGAASSDGLSRRPRCHVPSQRVGRPRHAEHGAVREAGSSSAPSSTHEGPLAAGSTSSACPGRAGWHSSAAAGSRATKPSGPESTVSPPTGALSIFPPGRSSRFQHDRPRSPARLEFVCGGQPGDPRADDGHLAGHWRLGAAGRSDRTWPVIGASARLVVRIAPGPRRAQPAPHGPAHPDRCRAGRRGPG